MTDDHFVESNEKVVYQTDSTEWHVCMFATGKLYADAVQVSMPAPWRIPTREEAQILNRERSAATEVLPTYPF